MPLVINTNELDYMPQIARTKAVRTCEQLLQTQGLIEPLCLDSAMEFSAQWYDECYLQAACNLGWDTVLITWPGENRK